jgi:hypothetical protein
MTRQRNPFWVNGLLALVIWGVACVSLGIMLGYERNAKVVKTTIEANRLLRWRADSLADRNACLEAAGVDCTESFHMNGRPASTDWGKVRSSDITRGDR